MGNVVLDDGITKPRWKERSSRRLPICLSLTFVFGSMLLICGFALAQDALAVLTGYRTSAACDQYVCNEPGAPPAEEGAVPEPGDASVIEETHAQRSEAVALWDGVARLAKNEYAVDPQVMVPDPPEKVIAAAEAVSPAAEPSGTAEGRGCDVACEQYEEDPPPDSLGSRPFATDRHGYWCGGDGEDRCHLYREYYECDEDNCGARGVPSDWECIKLVEGRYHNGKLLSQKTKIFCTHPLYGKITGEKIPSAYCFLAYDEKGRRIPGAHRSCLPGAGKDVGEQARKDSQGAVDAINEGRDKANGGQNDASDASDSNLVLAVREDPAIDSPDEGSNEDESDDEGYSGVADAAQLASGDDSGNDDPEGEAKKAAKSKPQKAEPGSMLSAQLKVLPKTGGAQLWVGGGFLIVAGLLLMSRRIFAG